jgi:purine-cytosine permease-like protein
VRLTWARARPRSQCRAGESDADVRRETLDTSIGHDFSASRTGIVPLSQRRPMWHFAGLWTTFVAGFSFMVPGFVMHDGGFSLAATAGVSLLGYGIYVAYALVGSFLGAQTGQTLTLLTRAVFGRLGSWLVSLLVMIPALGWVGFQAGVLAQLWHGFYSWGHLEAITIALAAVMIFNNLFGFTGISLFARYLVTPVLVIWCAYLVVKGFAAGAASQHAVTGPRYLPYWVAVAAVIGFAMWGNEADVWRYGRPRFWWPLPTYLFACFWFLLFAVAGWMMANLAGDGNRFNFTVRFSLFGAFWLAFLVATISQFAINDANYYEAVNAAQNLLGDWRRWRRAHTCLLLAGCGALGAWIVNYKIMNAWYAVPVFLAITAPCATVIMAVDRLALPRFLGVSRPTSQVPAWQKTAVANWPGVVSLLAGSLYGATASAILPGHLGFSEPQDWGPIPFESWLLAGLCYLALALAVKQTSGNPEHVLGFPRAAPQSVTSAPERMRR